MRKLGIIRSEEAKIAPGLAVVTYIDQVRIVQGCVSYSLLCGIKLHSCISTLIKYACVKRRVVFELANPLTSSLMSAFCV